MHSSFYTALLVSYWMILKFVSAEINECTPKLDVILLLDTSNSIKDAFKDQVQWANALVSLLPVSRNGVHVGAIQYSGIPMIEFALNTYTETVDVQDHLKGMEHRTGVTRTGAALRKAEDELFNQLRGGRPFARKVIILMTDGLSIDDPVQIAEKLRNEDKVSIFAAGLTDDAYVPELVAITGNASNCFKKSELASIESQILKIMRELLENCHNISTNAFNATTAAEIVTDSATLKQSDNNHINEPISTTLELPNSKLKNFANEEANVSVTVEEIESTTTNSTISLNDANDGSQLTTVEAQEEATSTHEKNNTTSKKSGKRRCILNSSDSEADVESNDCLDGPVITIDKNEKIQNISSLNDEENAVKETATVGRLNATDKRPCSANILFVLDSSSSMKGEFASQKRMIKDIVGLLKLDPDYHRVALMQFAGYATQEAVFSFDTFQSTYFVDESIDTLNPMTGTTYVGAALQFARNMLHRRNLDAKTFLILVTDGFSQDDAVQPGQMLRSGYDAELFALTKSKENDRSYLGRIVGGGDHVFVGNMQIQAFKETLKKKLYNCDKKKH